MGVLYNRFKLNSLLKKCKIGILINEPLFNKIMKIIRTKDFIIKFNNLLKHLLGTYSKYTFKNKIILDEKIDSKFARKVLTAFLLVKFPHIICSNKTEFNESLCKYANDIYNVFNNINKNNKLLDYIKLIDLIHKFNTAYNLWSMLDKRINTYMLLQMYYKNTMRLLEIPSDSNLTEVLKNSIENDQKEILKSIEFMNDKNEINFFNYNKDNLEYNKVIDEKLFLINLRYRLTKTNPDKLVFIELIEKTKYLLKCCVPNKTEHHNNVDNILDTELMETYIKNNILDNNYLYTIINIIIDKVREYQASADDVSLDEFRTKCNNKLLNGVLYKDFFPFFFMEILKRLEKIIDERRKLIEIINK